MSREPAGLDQFIAQGDKVPEAASGAPGEPGEPAGLNEFIGPELKEAKYGTVPQQLLAGVEGLGEGFAGPLATGAERLASKAGIPGLTPEDQAGRAEANPVTHGAAEIVGFGAGALTGTGEAALLSKAGDLAVGASQFGKYGTGAIRGAVEMGLMGGGNEVSKAINNDPVQTAGSALTNIGLSSLIGGVSGGALSAISPKWWEAAKTEAEQGIQDFKNSMNGSVIDHEAEAPLRTMEEHFAKPKAGTEGAEVYEIGKRHDWPVMEGMVDKNKLIQMAEDSLISGQPTFASIARTRAYDEALSKVTSAVDQASGAESTLSETQAGNVFKQSILSNLERRYAPIKQLYSEIEPYRNAIPISDRSTGPLARNITKIIEDQGLVPGSERYNFVKTFADGIENVDNLQKLANFRTEVNRSSGPMTKDLAGAIAEKLNGVEERSLKRFAETMQTSPAKEKILGLVEQAEQAKSGYAAFREQLQTLGNAIGKKKIYGPQNFMDFLEEMNPQTLARRLFNENNTEFAQYFAKTFPDEMKVMRNYQRGLIRQGAMKDGKLDAAKAVKEILGMEPEMKKLLFSPEELRTLQDAQKYMGSFPKKYNPSGTSHMSAFREFFQSPVSAASSNIRDFGIDRFIKAFGHVSPGSEAEAESLFHVLGRPALNKDPDAMALKHSVEYVLNAIRGDKAMTRLARGVFVGSMPEVKNAMADEGIDKLDETVKKYQENPDLFQGVGKKTAHYLPDHDIAVKAMAANVINYLSQIRPKNQKLSPFDAEIEPSKAEMSGYNRALKIAQQPLSVMKLLDEGKLTQVDVNHLQAMYPAVAKTLNQKIMAEMSDHMGKDATIPYAKRIGLSTLLGQPLDSTMSVPTMQSIISANAPKGPPPAPPGKQRKVSHSTARTMEKVDKSYATPLQSREAERVSG